MPDKKPFIIGITGSSGSGKTFFLTNFLNHFQKDEISLISQDDYYIPVGEMTKEENKLYNFDLPKTINDSQFLTDIKKLIKGNAVYKKKYNFNNPLAETKIIEINPAPILIIEGLFIFYFKKIAGLLDMKIFIEADEHIALKRRIKRDGIERGYDQEDVLYKWNNHVVPSYKEFLLPYKAICDKIIANNEPNSDKIYEITQLIAEELKEFFKNRQTLVNTVNNRLPQATSKLL